MGRERPAGPGNLELCSGPRGRPRPAGHSTPSAKILGADRGRHYTRVESVDYPSTGVIPGALVGLVLGWYSPDLFLVRPSLFPYSCSL